MSVEPMQLQVTTVEPVSAERRGATAFADFGKAAYGNLQIHFAGGAPHGAITVRLGEKLAADGSIDRTPPGSISYREATFEPRPGAPVCQPILSPKSFHDRPACARMPGHIGEVAPFRYAEVESAHPAAAPAALRQLFVHAPFNDAAASFACSDETLNSVWDLCRHTMKATSAFGIYIDGERERLAYEADAYINQLSHYACDLDPRVARQTFAHLLKYPTWPTEWASHMPMMAAADFMATGDAVLACDHYVALLGKLLLPRAREDGLVRAEGIVDWPAGERDGYGDGVGAGRQIGPEINTVVNAFHYHSLGCMALLARALGRAEASELSRTAARVREAFNRALFDAGRGVYIDGVGSEHASLHANMLALAFGLVPAGRQKAVADHVVSRGMACSVYGAQYLLEALFAAGRDDHAVALMTARTERSWWHMIEIGSTMTLEAWDEKFKPNLTWNHAWGAAPGNAITRFVLGVRPLEPGYAKLLIAPQPGTLRWAKGKVPTAVGSVAVSVRRGERFEMEVEIPAGAVASLALPRAAGGLVKLDGRSVPTRDEGTFVLVDNVPPGSHTLAGGPGP